LISENTIKMVHWMVKTYFSTYKTVLKYFVSYDRPTLLKREPKTRKKTALLNQELYIFPDIRTLQNTVSVSVLKDPSNLFLHSRMSPKQKDQARRAIKK